MEDALSYRPRRALEWEEEKGRVTLLRPRFGSSRWGRRLALWTGGHHYRIRLDEVGSVIWKAIDGETTMAQLAEKAREHFGESIEPAEERVAEFVKQLLGSRLIEL